MALPITWVMDPRTDHTVHALRAGARTFCGLHPRRSPITPRSPGQWVIVRQPERASLCCATCLAALKQGHDASGV
jgi:hypothetical protein